MSKADIAYQIFCDDAQHLDKYVTEPINAVITDPPAGINFFNSKWDDPGCYNTFSLSGSKREAFVQSLSNIFDRCRHLVTKNAVLVIWTLPRTSHWTARALLDAGWHINGEFYHIFFTGQPKSQSIANNIKKTINNPEIIARWEGWGTSLKPNYEKWLVAHLNPHESFSNHYYYCKKINAQERKISSTLQNTHPSLKTIELMSYIVGLYTQPNDKILDPFMGSGTTGVAALKMRRSFVGFETNKQYFDFAQARLADNIFEELEF